MATIRRAEARDLETLLRLCARYCEADSHQFDPVTVTAGFGPLLLSDQHGVVWLSIDGDEVVGYAVVTWSWSIESGGPDALLDEIYVDRPGEGHGSALVAHLLADCRRRKLPRVFLETEQANHEARRLYSRLGFRTEDSVWMVADLPGGPEARRAPDT
jgi:ribosomal protein S18 acetylase RimI-like enzyme